MEFIKVATKWSIEAVDLTDAIMALRKNTWIQNPTVRIQKRNRDGSYVVGIGRMDIRWLYYGTVRIKLDLDKIYNELIPEKYKLIANCSQ
jgi:hypothetical protein